MKIKSINKDKGLAPPSGAFDFRPNRTVDSNPKFDNMKGDYVDPKKRKRRKYYAGGNFMSYAVPYKYLEVESHNNKIETPKIISAPQFTPSISNKSTVQSEEEPTYSVYWGGSEDSYEEPQGLVDLLNAEGFKFRVTSGYRPGALTSKGTPSNHSLGDEQHPGAYDIVPLDGNFKSFRQALYTNPNVVRWLRTNNWGILEETTPEVKNQTKATGNHFHFGPDNWAKQMSEKAYKEFGV